MAIGRRRGEDDHVIESWLVRLLFWLINANPTENQVQNSMSTHGKPGPSVNRSFLRMIILAPESVVSAVSPIHVYLHNNLLQFDALVQRFRHRKLHRIKSCLPAATVRNLHFCAKGRHAEKAVHMPSLSRERPNLLSCWPSPHVLSLELWEKDLDDLGSWGSAATAANPGRATTWGDLGSQFGLSQTMGH